MKREQFYAALLILTIGLVGLWESWHYDRGTLARMGPGYYPFALSIGLIILGILAAIIPSADQPEDLRKTPAKAYIRPWAGVLGGAILFVILSTFGGLIPATFALLLVAGLGDRANSLRDCLLLAVGGVIFTVVVFHYAMSIQFPLWRWG